jgi:hypothetical protein
MGRANEKIPGRVNLKVAFGEHNCTHWPGKLLRVELPTHQRVGVQFLAHNVDKIQRGISFRK